jgi:hypothetical protein
MHNRVRECTEAVVALCRCCNYQVIRYNEYTRQTMRLARFFLLGPHTTGTILWSTFTEEILVRTAPGVKMVGMRAYITINGRIQTLGPRFVILIFPTNSRSRESGKRMGTSDDRNHEPRDTSVHETHAATMMLHMAIRLLSL